jgi:hypothetical protein
MWLPSTSASVSDPAAEGGDQRLDLHVREHAVEPRSLDVQDLAPERQNRLEGAVAALLRGPPGGVALHDEELALAGISLLTVRQLPGEAEVGERTLPPR